MCNPSVCSLKTGRRLNKRLSHANKHTRIIRKFHRRFAAASERKRGISGYSDTHHEHHNLDRRHHGWDCTHGHVLHECGDGDKLIWRFSPNKRRCNHQVFRWGPPRIKRILYPHQRQYLHWHECKHVGNALWGATKHILRSSKVRCFLSCRFGRFSRFRARLDRH